MTEVYYKEDVDQSILSETHVSIIGYGSQGRGQTLNLKDSGIDLTVGLKPDSSSREKVEEDGVKVSTVEEAAEEGDIIMMLTPDEVMPQVYKKQIEPNLDEGCSLAFSHGFNIHYSQIIPPKNIDIFMVAPKGPGDLVREMYKEGNGVPGLLAIYQDYSGQAFEKGLAYADGIGCTQAGVLETTFAEETETDLFGEQVDLCGGVTALIKATFEMLVKNGYQPEIAYFESLHELNLIVSLIQKRGLKGMWKNVSNTAEYGGLTRGERVIGKESRKEMEKILEEIQSGEFAKEWVLENKTNRPSLEALRKKEENHEIEEVGEKLRSIMEWL